jgi:acyl carrier protein
MGAKSSMMPRKPTVKFAGAKLRIERKSQVSGFIFISRMLARLALRHFALHSEQIQALVLQQAKRLDKCADQSLSIEASFKTLGLDSLDAVELVTALEDQLGVSLPDAEVKKLASLGDVATAFHSKLGS